MHAVAVPHRLQRPNERAGLEPIEVFRSVAPQSRCPRQVPQSWVKSRPAFQSLESNPRPDIAAALFRANVPSVDKAWTELACEAVRVEVAGSSPSRLNSVFCFADVFEALSFPESAGEAKEVYKGVIEDGVPWVVVDMGKFAQVTPTSYDAAGYEQAWETARAQAYGYWAPDAAIDDLELAEILVAGPVLIEGSPLRLIPTMRDSGLII